MLYWVVLAPLVVGSLVEEQWVGERRDRELLQVDEEGIMEGEGSESPLQTTTTTEEPFNKENMAGPEEFYLEKPEVLGQPKLLMEVEGGIRVLLYNQEGGHMDTIELDQAAIGGIQGSGSADANQFQVDINYKGQSFKGDNGNLIKGIQLELSFTKSGLQWSLSDLKIVTLAWEGEFLSYNLSTTSSHGYRISAPLGLAWCCQEAGRFLPTGNKTGQVQAGLQFPGLKLQVYEVTRGRFGAEWECGEVLSIGLLTGLLVSLGFATICLWGFSMLASINTMDRFDDPKGPAIYVPNTD